MLNALGRAGETEAALKLIRTYWGGMLDRGATMAPDVPEVFAPSQLEGELVPGPDTRLPQQVIEHLRDAEQAVRLAAVIEGDTRPISFQGGITSSLAPPKGMIEYVPLGVFVNASNPKMLVTSGLGGVFPPGLAIGQITKIESSTDGLFQTGEVQLDPRLSSLTEVTVLVPVNP